MANAKHGDSVRVHYTGTLDDGTVFDTSRQGDPLEFIIGSGDLLPAFERTVVGMDEGETRRTTLSVDQAYGPHLPERVLNLDRGAFPSDLNPEAGMHVELPKPDGSFLMFKILEVGDAEVRVDANHPLAGRELTYDIQLIEILTPSAEESGEEGAASPADTGSTEEGSADGEASASAVESSDASAEASKEASTEAPAEAPAEAAKETSSG